MENNAVDAILKQKRSTSQAESSLYWAFVNAVLALVLFYDISFNQSYLSKYFTYEFASIIIWYIEASLAILFSWNAIFDLFLYLWPNISMQYIALQPMQKILLGIKDSDPGFTMSTPKKPTTDPGAHSTPELLSSFVQAPYQMTPPRLYSPYSSYGGCSTPLDYSAVSWGSGNASPNTSLCSVSSSWNYYQDYPSLGQSCDGSFLMESPEHSLHKRTCGNNSFSSQQSVKITDEKSLDDFLTDYKRFEQKSLAQAKENQSGMNYSSNSLMHSVSHPLLKFQYQPACRSPQSSLALTGDPDSQTSFSGDTVWGRLKVSEDKLSAATENLRKWLSQTILGPLVSEIKVINETLKRMGSSDLQIGDVSLSTLRQIILTKGQFVPTLPTLISYLDLTINQEYLVQRLQELSLGGCMSDFRWNGGSNINGKTWTDELPTDCMIAMHIFCSYLDSRLPPHPNYPDGKTFFAQHFKKAPAKPTLTVDSLYIYQFKLNPPHYKLAMGEELLDVPKGRNNMFFTILLFLYYIKVNNCGMLGRINLGTSGVNILWVIDELKV